MTTRLYREDLVLPVAELGAENPLPPLVKPEQVQQVANLEELPADLAEGLGYGQLDTVLPCRLQDGYTRERTERSVPALVLENDHVRATILPSLGGRLYSLYSKEDDRELLYRNPVLQPANLALRGAWFAGGVEWNLGSTGHTTLTCAPMHAAEVGGPDGTPILRLWEWERTRDLPYQVDFWLPDGSDFLLVGVRVRNPHDHDVPVYWWSNIAVEQTPRTRVVAPADSAWHYGYGGRLDLVGVPEHHHRELTYPARHRSAADYFFEVPEESRRWIAAVDGDGFGLAQVSTSRQRGRKLFVWGESAGGRRWQDWLSPGAEGYLEIQAGLARTQLEHLRLPAGEEWDWLEAYGPVRARSSVVHGSDWAAAQAEVRRRLPDGPTFEGLLAAWRTVAEAEPRKPLYEGSGWGALELHRMLTSLPGIPFAPETMGPEQAPWLALLEGEPFGGDPAVAPGGTLVNKYWRELLEYASAGWATSYHRGVARRRAGEREDAVAAWRESVELAENPWALRNLAIATESPELYRRALELAPDVPALAVEAIAAQVPERALELIERLQPETRALGRIRLLEARARLALGEVDGMLAIFDAGFDVADVREGETSLSDTWVAAQKLLAEAGREVRPLPGRYDFRMSAE